jgi:L-alanine-DL-glutamate epimerase-like enolase superfamily enzyme
MALWDLEARALGVPVHSLFGGCIKDRITLRGDPDPRGSA